MIVKATGFEILRSGKTQTRKIKKNPKEVDIRRAFRDIFSAAVRSKKKTLNFNLLGIEQGFPVIGVAKIVSQEILRFCRAFPGIIKNMNLVIEDVATFALFEKQVYGYLHHVQEDLGCGPYPTVDMIIEYQGGIVVIERTNPPYGFALPGGFVDNGETLEHAAMREAKEETNLKLVAPKQFHTYSDPARDPRFQTISTVFIAKGQGKLNAGDDAKGAQVILVKDILKYKFAFDHKQIIIDYLKTKRY